MVNAHKWLVVRYKINQLKRLEHNLQNQNLNFYSPKITKKSHSSKMEKKKSMFLLIFIVPALILLISMFSLFEIFLLILLLIQFYSKNHSNRLNAEKLNQI